MITLTTLFSDSVADLRQVASRLATGLQVQEGELAAALQVGGFSRADLMQMIKVIQAETVVENAKARLATAKKEQADHETQLKADKETLEQMEREYNEHRGPVFARYKANYYKAPHRLVFELETELKYREEQLAKLPSPDKG